MDMDKDQKRRPIILLIDGECLLCHGVTQFVIRRDPSARFRFATLQSDFGTGLLERAGLSTRDRDTFVMIDNGIYYSRSTAALRTLWQLGGIWRLCYAGIVVPVSLRDRVYHWIARNRYLWFGRSTSCILWADRRADSLIVREVSE